MKLNKTIASVLILMMIIPSLIIFSANVNAVPSYYVNITINHSVDGSLTNYAVPIVIHKGIGSNSAGNIYLNNHAINWPNDIWFTDNSNNVINYWRQNYTTSIQVVWINLTLISSTGTTNFKLYYGDGRIDSSNGNRVFPIFDDFLGTSINTTLWNINSPGAGTITQSVGNLHIVKSATSGNYPTVYTRNMYNSASYGLLANICINQTGTLQEGITERSSMTTNNAFRTYYIASTVEGWHYYIDSTASGTYTQNAIIGSAVTAGNYYTIDEGMRTSLPKLNVAVPNAPYSAYTQSSYGFSTNIYFELGQYNIVNASAGTVTLHTDFNWIAIHKITPNEPTWNTASSENNVRLYWYSTFTNSPTLTGLMGDFYSYNPTINETGTFIIISKPSWLNWYSSNNTLSGISINGISAISIMVTSIAGTLNVYNNFTLTIYQKWNPIFTNSPCLIGYENFTYKYSMTFNESVTVAILSKPSWLNYVSTNYTLYGKSETGIYSISIQAVSINGYKSSYINYSLIIYNIPIIYTNIYHNSTVYVDVYHNSTEYIDVYHNITTYINSTIYVDVYHNETIYIDRWHNETIDIWHNETIYIDRWHNETIYQNSTFEFLSMPRLNITQSFEYYYYIVTSQPNATINVTTNSLNITYNNTLHAIVGTEQDIKNISISILSTYLGQEIYQNFTLEIKGGNNTIDSQAFIIIIWVIINIAFTAFMIVDRRWGILGGMFWCVGSVFVYFPLDHNLGMVTAGIGMFALVIGMNDWGKHK